MMLERYSVFRSHLFGTNTQKQNFCVQLIPSPISRYSKYQWVKQGSLGSVYIRALLSKNKPNNWCCFMNEERPKVGSKTQS